MKPRDLTVSSFVADTHALGPHWVYNQHKLAAVYPDGVVALDAPRSAYHPDKGKGDFTHYGDQALELLRSIERHGGYDVGAWHANLQQAGAQGVLSRNKGRATGGAALLTVIVSKQRAIPGDTVYVGRASSPAIMVSMNSLATCTT